MQEVLEKIIKRLEEVSWWTQPTYDDDGYCNDDREDVVYLDKAIEIVNAVAEEYKEKAMSEWCHDCKEYDKEKHNCPRFCKVIRSTVEEIKEGYSKTHTDDCK